jgi:hypothetical protein
MAMVFTALALWFVSSIAIGQEATAESVIAGYLSGLPSIGKLIGFAITLQVCLRLLAELLLKISEMTETKVDNKVAAWISEAAWVLGLGISKFGYSVPKVVVEEKAKTLPAEAKKDGQA